MFDHGDPEQRLLLGQILQDLQQSAFGVFLFVAILPAFIPIPGLGGAVKAIPLEQKSGREDYLYIEDVEGLLQLVQMNTLELHPWGATVEDPEHPDRLVFDLDPGEGVNWTQIKAAARDVRARLQEAGLESFVRLSGGKGVHVVVPLQPKADWAHAKDFCEAFAQAMATHRSATWRR